MSKKQFEQLEREFPTTSTATKREGFRVGDYVFKYATRNERAAAPDQERVSFAKALQAAKASLYTKKIPVIGDEHTLFQREEISIPEAVITYRDSVKRDLQTHVCPIYDLHEMRRLQNSLMQFFDDPSFGEAARLVALVVEEDIKFHQTRNRIGKTSKYPQGVGKFQPG